MHDLPVRLPTAAGAKAASGAAAGDEAVRLTNDDAASGKLSAVTLGYYEDPFVRHFVPGRTHQRREPMMNRGFWSRVEGIALLTQRFLQAGEPNQRKQIVCLGAGFDTSFFRLKAKHDAQQPFLVSVLDVDMPQVVQKKISIVANTLELRNLVSSQWDPEVRIVQEAGHAALHSPHYHLCSCDLRHPQQLRAAVESSGFDPTLPTLFVSECVLIYLEPEDGTALINWTASTFSHAAFLTYEQIHPHDPFGVVMLRNLEQRGCNLRSILAYPDKAAQTRRYQEAGWRGAGQVEVWDMIQVYERLLDRAQVKRVERIEHLDELEEWRIIQSHYCIVFARPAATPTPAASASLSAPPIPATRGVSS
jgi:tRNA wybutosine-synthesizing protein 4